MQLMTICINGKLRGNKMKIYACLTDLSQILGPFGLKLTR